MSGPKAEPPELREFDAWDAYAAAALTGSLWWNRHTPIAADDPAKDAALIADELLELRRVRMAQRKKLDAGKGY